jgi:hypothetical protein
VYRAHLAADPETGIITDEKLTKASGEDNSDPALAAEFPAAGHGQHAYGETPRWQPLSWHADSAPVTCGTRSGRPGMPQ